MSRTTQQQQAISLALNPENELIKIQACAGAGKTFTLVELAKELSPKTGLYLAYNKAIAEEATAKFKGTKIKCSTTHSMAWSHTVRQYGLKVGFFNARDVKPYNTNYKTKLAVATTIEEFCLSSEVDPVQYLESIEASNEVSLLVMEHINAMTDGEISCSHSFYLKLFHVYLANGTITIPEVDLLLVDEAGDITGLTLAIFKLLKAKKKIAVGDPMQNIYSFNKTINAFKELKNEGVETTLTESFRVSDRIAYRIEHFVNKHIDKDFQFTGRYYPKDAIVTTRAYIARNNTGLLQEMFALKHAGVCFNTTRTIDSILELPLILSDIENYTPITDFKYKHLEALRKEWVSVPRLHREYPTAIKYISKSTKDDRELSSAFNVVDRYGKKGLQDLATYARKCAKAEHPLTLTTSHSSKGLEFTSVEIAPDLNAAVEEALLKIKQQELMKTNENTESTDKRIYELQEELRLYYVACSRAMIELINATQLTATHLIRSKT